ncbi:MAG: 2,3-bisphosphoglycerate-independent phosphoglycerate mutase [Mycoplasmoidaceae bacterium]|nr:MAG: 2,3-bisphosphoglycerate-independent phosphoglycerate mutase [Mycoplasmoidaceae bacterium]
MSTKKAVLLIMDGVGINKKTKGNAVKQANTPNLDNLLKIYPNTTLQASGEQVGLPVGQMGNSEVGHLNIGAGRIVYTGLSLINKELDTKEFFNNEAFNNAIKHTKDNESKVHIIGLISNGGVHSSLEHIKGLIELMGNKKANCVIHVVGDGRDVAPQSLKGFLLELLPLMGKNNIKLGSISGRYYMMDRDKNWDRNMKAYNVLVGDSDSTFDNPFKYIDESYAKNTSDEFIIPAYNNDFKKDEICLRDGDSVIVANFRPDRSRQISHLIFDSNYYDYNPKNRKKNLYFVTMMKYEGIEPSMVAYELKNLPNVLGKVLEDNNLTQLRIAETEKYAHVTFFFDGGFEHDYKGEEKIIVASPKVATYDLKPEMSANEVCDKLLKRMDDFDVIVVNFANGDMVGHTGNMNATIKAIETVDSVVGKIYEKSKKTNSTLFITADHGNADVMLDDNDEVVTSHTTNEVPFIVTDKSIKLKSNLQLGNIAPTIIEYLGLKTPNEMLESIKK